MYKMYQPYKNFSQSLKHKILLTSVQHYIYEDFLVENSILNDIPRYIVCRQSGEGLFQSEQSHQRVSFVYDEMKYISYHNWL